MVPVSTETNGSDLGQVQVADPVGRKSGLIGKAGPSRNGADEVPIKSLSSLYIHLSVVHIYYTHIYIHEAH